METKFSTGCPSLMIRNSYNEVVISMKKKKLEEIIKYLEIGLSLYPLCVEETKPKLYKAMKDTASQNKKTCENGIIVINEYLAAINRGDYG